MTRKVLSDGVEIAFEVEGDGAPLVLLHGFSDSRVSWRDLGYVDDFLRAGRRPVLVDARGHGESGRPHDPDRYAPRQLAADVIAVLDALGIPRADILGYSMGGWTALALACHFPVRLRAVAAGGAHPYAHGMQMFRDAIAAGLEAWVGVVESMAGPLPAGMRTRLLGNDARALAAAVARDRPDISAGLAASRVPLLLYAGEADPRHAPAKRFAGETGAAFLGLPGVNHMRALFAKELVVPEAITFFEGHARRRETVYPSEISSWRMQPDHRARANQAAKSLRAAGGRAT